MKLQHLGLFGLLIEKRTQNDVKQAPISSAHANKYTQKITDRSGEVKQARWIRVDPASNTKYISTKEQGIRNEDQVPDAVLYLIS
jgi:hypothetical protein